MTCSWATRARSGSPGPNVFKGYWNDAEATAAALTDDGWLRTGDVAVVDDDGQLFLVDRVKDLIIVSGFNVFPAEVEAVLLEHPAVEACGVIGVSHPYTGEAVKAYVVVSPGRSVEEDDLIAFCAERLARYKCPEKVMFVDEIPLGTTGKVLRRHVMPLAARHIVSPTSASGGRRHVRATRRGASSCRNRSAREAPATSRQHVRATRRGASSCRNTAGGFDDAHGGAAGSVGEQEAGEQHGDADDQGHGEAVHLVEHRVEEPARAQDQRPERDQDVGAGQRLVERRRASRTALHTAPPMMTTDADPGRDPGQNTGQRPEDVTALRQRVGDDGPVSGATTITPALKAANTWTPMATRRATRSGESR